MTRYEYFVYTDSKTPTMFTNYRLAANHMAKYLGVPKGAGFVGPWQETIAGVWFQLGRTGGWTSWSLAVAPRIERRKLG